MYHFSSLIGKEKNQNESCVHFHSVCVWTTCILYWMMGTFPPKTDPRQMGWTQFDQSFSLFFFIRFCHLCQLFKFSNTCGFQKNHQILNHRFNQSIHIQWCFPKPNFVYSRLIDSQTNEFWKWKFNLISI